MRIRKKTAAASVEATIDPSSIPWTGVKPSAPQTARATIAAVTRTPTEASSSEGAITSRKLESRVRSPPSNRITDSAIIPTR